MNNLGTLIKIHIKTSFGFNKAKFSTDKKAAGRSTGMSVLLIICYILILFAVFAMALGMTYSLQAIGAEYIMPVSYTHLDVYKRQVQCYRDNNLTPRILDKQI